MPRTSSTTTDSQRAGTSGSTRDGSGDGRRHEHVRRNRDAKRRQDDPQVLADQIDGATEALTQQKNRRGRRRSRMGPPQSLGATERRNQTKKTTLTHKRTGEAGAVRAFARLSRTAPQHAATKQKINPLLGPRQSQGTAARFNETKNDPKNPPSSPPTTPCRRAASRRSSRGGAR
jgi:hypothetical protein